ncbi:pilus assembly PilX family protein [Thiocapsa roseopersicina]|uniref:Type 4 fimbrial biogenesis protein PilX N-terminal domain-containing protein n=1 Tax=Thiocapsa roseopersicina TaxID=1058 RepID=A0A1H2Z365_THIRO|nr:PilX N-terminal domain-containing pilus assembly protein [Thiocapsa roseopersicina]SDX11816.1 hypothetical protein SAMN05421783_114107 [Thiocapsa roseopersicina]
MNEANLLRKGERGAVLVIALIMLLITTLIAVATFEMGSTNFLVVANLEAQRQAQKAAESTLEEAITRWTQLKNSLVIEDEAVFYCQGRKNHKCIDINEDSIVDIDIALDDPNPFCISVSPITNDSLDPADMDDQGCFIGKAQTGAVDGSGSGRMSMCSDAVWDIYATVTDLPWSDSRPARAIVRQGVGVRESNNSIPHECR